MKRLLLTRYLVILTLLWTVIVSASLVWNLVATEQSARDAVHNLAEASFQKDVLFRRWSARNGGVYVPVTEITPPNPYLSNIPERDLVTPSGRKLTLVNPAYMTRQVYEIAAAETGIQGHITSLNPLRPENGPDPWEAEALRRFEAGEIDVDSFQTIDGQATKMTISAGVAAYDGVLTDGTTLISRADNALYEAKHKGRNRIVLWSGENSDGWPAGKPLRPKPEGRE